MPSLKSLEVDFFQNLPNLRTLKIQMVHLQEMPKFYDHENLESIEISESQIETIGKDHFRNVPSLKSLSIDENSFLWDIDNDAFRDLDLSRLKIWRDWESRPYRNLDFLEDWRDYTDRISFVDKENRYDRADAMGIEGVNVDIDGPSSFISINFDQ